MCACPQNIYVCNSCNVTNYAHKYIQKKKSHQICTSFIVCMYIMYIYSICIEY